MCRLQSGASFEGIPERRWYPDMKALVYHGPGERGWDTVDDPAIVAPTDAIVRIDTSTICGTDLHILKGDVPACLPGTVLGHEAVGVVEEVGAGVTTVAAGDRVLMSCVSACGRCRYCKEQRYGQCLGGGGWIFGHLIDGLQAEYARVPFADNSVYKVPDSSATSRSCSSPTSFRRPSRSACSTAWSRPATSWRSSAPDRSAWPRPSPRSSTRRAGSWRSTSTTRAWKARRQFGADTLINNGSEDAVARVMELTDGLGADVAFEAVGVPQTFELATELIRPGGRVANIGVHGSPVTLHLETLWIRDVTITTGLVDTFSIPQLMRLIAVGPLGPVAVRHAPLRARRHDGRLRRVRRRGEHQRAEGRARGCQRALARRRYRAGRGRRLSGDPALLRGAQAPRSVRPGRTPLPATAVRLT